MKAVLGVFFNKQVVNKPAAVLTDFSLEVRNPDTRQGEFWPSTLTVRDRVEGGAVRAELLGATVVDKGKGVLYIYDELYWMMLVQWKRGKKP